MTDRIRRLLITLPAVLALATPAVAAELRSPEIWTDPEGRALKGYDTVAYHLERRPLKGDPAFSVEWKGATWLFSSAENRDKFVADPERWAPQYGGYCAWAVTKDRLVGVNPTIFRIFDDKLYLNLNMKVHKEWLAKHEVFITRANEKWPDVLVMSR